MKEKCMSYSEDIGSLKGRGIKRESTVNGEVFKSERKFYEKPNSTCYVPELDDTRYTANDFIALCNGNKAIAEDLFFSVDWQHPETLLEEWERDGEVIYDTETETYRYSED